MKRLRPLPLLAALMPLLLTAGMSVAKAQPPDDPMSEGGPLFDDGPGGHRPPPGGFGGPGGGRGAKGHLDGFLHGMERLKNSSNDVSKAQAQKIVALIKPWSNRATMNDTDAQKLVTSLEAILTGAQKSNFGPPGGGRGGPPRGGRNGPPGGGGDFRPPPDGGFGGPDGGPPPGEGGPPPDGDFGPPPGGGPGGPGGPSGGPQGGPRGQRLAIPATFNPFYAPTGRSDWKKLSSHTQQLLARRYRENRAILERLSRRTKI